MNTVEALKELYKSFGGKLTDTYSNIADGIPVGNYSVIPDCFAALAEIAGGSIELPVVTQADAGDVLTVGEDGKWTKAEPTKELPTVTASDNGSVLSVVDGAWAKTTLIKKVSKTFIVDGDAFNYLSFDVPEAMTKNIIGVSLNNESIILGAGKLLDPIIALNAEKLIVRYDVKNGYLPRGTYTLDVFYIEA